LGEGGHLKRKVKSKVQDSQVAGAAAAGPGQYGFDGKGYPLLAPIGQNTEAGFEDPEAEDTDAASQETVPMHASLATLGDEVEPWRTLGDSDGEADGLEMAPGSPLEEDEGLTIELLESDDDFIDDLDAEDLLGLDEYQAQLARAESLEGRVPDWASMGVTPDSGGSSSSSSTSTSSASSSNQILLVAPTTCGRASRREQVVTRLKAKYEAEKASAPRKKLSMSERQVLVNKKRAANAMRMQERLFDYSGTHGSLYGGPGLPPMDLEEGVEDILDSDYDPDANE
jgi:hypothetical protein